MIRDKEDSLIALQDASARVLVIAQGDAAPLGRPGTPSSPATMVAAGAILVGCLLVAYWYRRRMLSGAPRGTVSASDLASDMQELSDRLASDLEARAERLERLLALASGRIRELERLIQLQPAAETRLIEPKPQPRGEGVDASHLDVYELADNGHTPVEIAKRLDRPTGQVELILNLRRGTVSL